MIAPLPTRDTIAPAADRPRAMAPAVQREAKARRDAPPRPPHLSL
ncbi:hypothetical protein [Sphingomicrobium arenosum]|nr:hypothetical protein [Sphingomicrobium arenosum]